MASARPGHPRARGRWWGHAASLLAVAPGVVFVTGGMLALASTGRIREAQLHNGPALLVSVALHAGSPRRGWPPPVRSLLPGSSWVDLGLAAAALGLTAAGASASRRRGYGKERAFALGRGGKSALQARAPGPLRSSGALPGVLARGLGSSSTPGWARARELRALLVPRSPGDRIVIGRLGSPGRERGRLVAAERGQSLLVVGPTQCGKTSGLAIPAILEWDGPVLATSVKGDLLRETHEWRRRLGEVWCFDPTRSLGVAGESWSPLAAASTFAGARRVASALCSVARSDGGGLEDAGFWYSHAEKLLAPLLFAASSAGCSMGDVVRWLDTEEVGEVMLALELAGDPVALRAARACLLREERQRASVYATTETVVAAFADPEVMAATAASEIDPAALVSGSSATLYCCAPARAQERLAPVFTALVREVLDAAFDRATRTGRPLDPPLLVVLDEAANVAPLSDLDRIAATAAGHGVQLVTVWQDLAQVEARYGRRWATVANNHRAKLVCSGISDPLTLDHLSGLIGEEARGETSRSVGQDGHWTRTDSVAWRPMASPAWLRRLPIGACVLVYGNLPPARLALRPHYSSGDLASRAAQDGEPGATFGQGRSRSTARPRSRRNGSQW